jgi:hypothetical protein
MPGKSDGRNVLVAGATGSGKTAWAMQQIGRAPRLLVWDAMGEWARRARLTAVADLDELGALVADDLMATGRFRVAYAGPVTRAHFETFCRIAWVYLRAAPGALVVEELADVTTPGKAPPAWGEIVRKGRHVGATVYALTQRPAESDKTIYGNAALIHAGRCGAENDRRRIAAALDVSPDLVRALSPLQWIERDLRTLRLTAGTVRFPR